MVKVENKMKYVFFICLGLVLSLSSYGKVVGQLHTPVANNAIAGVKTTAGWKIFSFNGLLAKKDHLAVSKLAQVYDVSSASSQLVETVPYQAGRLASIAVPVNDMVYLFGGYTVSVDHQEKSLADVYQFNPQTHKFTLFTQMPISVDDTVALVYKQRYIYLVSGWHDVGNISDVQVLDTVTKRWFYATPYPGKAVFGHGAGIVNNQMVVADGVKVAAIKNGRRQYQMSASSWLGIIDSDNLTQIEWSELPKHPGKAKYRMAVTGVPSRNKIVFAGGSDNPYNYNGIGYDKEPSQPSSEVFAWDIQSAQWQVLKPMSKATMDHRALVNIDGKLYIVGGMHSNQQVSGAVLSFGL